jgi:hypothetical protein
LYSPTEYGVATWSHRGGAEAALRSDKERTGGAFKSGHYDEDNIVVHYRFDDRDGGKTLHVAEVQSDWHQQARKLRKAEVERVAEEKGIDIKEADKLVDENFGYRNIPGDPQQAGRESRLPTGTRRTSSDKAGRAERG